MAGTTMLAVKTALTTALAARPALASAAGVQVAYATNERATHRQRVYLGAVEAGGHSNPVFRSGRVRREEEYVLHVMVDVVGYAKTPQANEARAVALALEVEEYLADNPQLDGSTGILHALISGMSMETLETTDGPYSTIDISVTVTARLL